ncbi:MAG: septal ring lytic transglycosylase RlpA family protein [Cellvibrionaceae bacterium]|nr:septal ring lytic transglycosylase RlpA family protein [Cellvibrionaceae bacterium]MCV6628044.1 septal ring lytic transglycosylase RlpA family protein [Cellvibrionaceae bacterium]
MPDSRGFNQRGVASWYGKKFHGRKTSNGEVYDMYAMTAAHKSLPLPSFVRVRNRNNGREVVVRVNDRGPFHGGRIIDLSYAAASKLGFVQHGTAPVEIEAIDSGSPALDFLSPKPTALAKSPDLQLKPGPEPELNYRYTSGRKRTFVQVGAFSNQDSATALAQRLRNALAQPVRLSRKPGTGIYRVQVGPLAMASKLLGVQKALQQMQLGSSIVIYE